MELGKIILSSRFKAPIRKEKIIGKLDYIKMKSVCSSTDATEGVKRQFMR